MRCVANEIEPHVGWDPDWPAAPVDDVQRAMQLPELALRIDLHDKRIRLRALHDAVVNARDRIGCHRVGERRIAALQVIVLPVLLRVGVGVGETNIDEDPIRTNQISKED